MATQSQNERAAKWAAKHNSDEMRAKGLTFRTARSLPSDFRCYLDDLETRVEELEKVVAELRAVASPVVAKKGPEPMCFTPSDFIDPTPQATTPVPPEVPVVRIPAKNKGGRPKKNYLVG